MGKVSKFQERLFNDNFKAGNGEERKGKGKLSVPPNTGTPGFSDLPTAEYVWCMVLHGRYAICVCWVPICPFFLIPYVETSNVVSTYKTMDSLGAIPEDRNVLCCTQVHFIKILSFCNFLRSL